jgi:hypothetical protein
MASRPAVSLCAPAETNDRLRVLMIYYRWRDQFAAILDRRMYSLDWLDDEVATGRVRLFANPAAAILAELRPYPTGAADLHFLIGAGSMEAMRDDLRPRAEAWAQSMGALGAVVESRSGWERTLRSCGYELFQTCLRKEFEPGSAGGEYRRLSSV